MVAVIYARYSDSKQREESIEAQVKVCRTYAEQKGYTVLHEYCDKALSGRTDDRPQFQRMIKESRKRQFERVLVYKLDRFSRNTLDHEIYKAALLKNGVKIESAQENIPDDSSGILLEGVLEAVSAWGSADISEKVRRNMILNAEKGLSNGGTIPLGYKLERINPKDERSKKRYVLNEETAPIVQEVFTKYANGVSMKEICDSLNERHLKSAQGAAFNKSSLHTMLRNRKYLGIYIYKDIKQPGGMPQIIDEDLFNKVKEKMELNKKNPGRARAKAEYLLTTKLFCGYCKEKMVGHSSNQISKKGVIFNYYKCKNSGGGKPCKKKMVPKDYIEGKVVDECRKLLTSDNIRRIAKEIVAIAKKYDDRSELNHLEGLMREAQEAKANQMTSLRTCKDEAVKAMIFEDLSNIAAEIENLEKQIEFETARRENITEEQIIEFLNKLADGDINDIVYRRSLIRLLVNKIFLYDDRFTITFNSGDDEVTITDVLLENIEQSFEGKSLCLLNNRVHQVSSPVGDYNKVVCGTFFFCFKELF